MNEIIENYIIFLVYYCVPQFNNLACLSRSIDNTYILWGPALSQLTAVKFTD